MIYRAQTHGSRRSRSMLKAFPARYFAQPLYILASEPIAADRTYLLKFCLTQEPLRRRILGNVQNRDAILTNNYTTLAPIFQA